MDHPRGIAPRREQADCQSIYRIRRDSYVEEIGCRFPGTDDERPAPGDGGRERRAGARFLFNPARIACLKLAGDTDVRPASPAR